MGQKASIEQLYCALLYLMSRQAREPQPQLPGLIQEHLRWLSAHPEAADLSALRATCDKLELHWRSEGTGHKRPTTPIGRKGTLMH